MRLLLAVTLAPFALVPQLPQAAEKQAFARVLVVDGGGGGQYSTIQPAIDAALPGDTVLVKGGTYPGFQVVGKGLSLVGEFGMSVTCTSAVLVDGVPTGQRVLLQNLTLRQTVGPFIVGALRVRNSAGGVRIESCIVEPQMRIDALHVEGSPDVLLRDTFVRGCDGPNLSFSASAGNAVTCAGSTVATYGSQFAGGDGGGGDIQIGGRGGDAWRQTSGELRAVQTSFTGGDGGESTDCLYGLGGNGGGGMLVTGASGRAQASTFAGGVGGLHPCGYTGSNGPALQYSPLLFTPAVPGPARTLSAPALVRDGSDVTFSMQGATGEAAFLLVSGRDTRETSSAYEGVLFARPSYLLRLLVGTASGAAPLTHTWSIPDELIPPGLSSTFTAQVVFQASNGAVTMSNPLTMVVLDSSL